MGDHTAEATSLYHHIYGNDDFRKWVQYVNGEGEMWPSDFPIELREYGRESRGMGCHPDLLMYNDQTRDSEFAVTVDNDSRCNVTYTDRHGKKHLVQTVGNSVIMVRAEASVHCVSSTKGGVRQILKFIYTGTYKKSKYFWDYSGNECNSNNPNVRAIMQQRAERAEL